MVMKPSCWLGLLSLALVACASPVVTAPVSPAVTTAPTASASLSPSPSATVTFICPPDPSPTPIPEEFVGLPSRFCSAEEVAVLTAVAPLGYTVRTITVVPGGFPCGIPFLTGPTACPFDVVHIRNAAYVIFAGTDRVAALTLTLQMTLALLTNGPIVATVVAFRVPPPGWIVP
jgi:hypothetical protein